MTDLFSVNSHQINLLCDPGSMFTTQIGHKKCSILVADLSMSFWNLRWEKKKSQKLSIICSIKNREKNSENKKNSLRVAKMKGNKIYSLRCAPYEWLLWSHAGLASVLCDVKVNKIHGSYISLKNSWILKDRLLWDLNSRLCSFVSLCIIDWYRVNYWIFPLVDTMTAYCGRTNLN